MPLSARDELALRQELANNPAPRRELEIRSALESGQVATQSMAPSNDSGLGQSSEAFVRNASSRFLGNVANIPNVASSILKIAGLQKAGEGLGQFAGMVSQIPHIGSRDIMQFQGADGRLSRALEPTLPLPNANDFLAMGQRAGEGAAALTNLDFSQFQPDARSQQQARTQELQESNPIASAFGTMTGDAATLLTGRMALRDRLNFTLPELGSKPIPAGFQAEVARLLNTPAMKTFFRGIGRTTEAGLEGATIALLNNDGADPLASAGFAAGAQASGSILRTISSSPTSLAMTAASATVALQMAKELTPAGRDSLIESGEQAIQKMLIFGAMGLIAGVAGSGRATGPQAQNIPLIAESLRTMPRGMIQSFLSDLTKDEEEGTNYTERTVLALARNPQAFDEGQLATLERALTSANQSFREAVMDLSSRDVNFFQNVEAVESTTDQEIFTSRINSALQQDNLGTRPLQSSPVADSIAQRLPESSSLKSFYKNNGPRTFIKSFFNNEDAFKKVFPRLGRKQKQDALEANLDRLLTSAVNDSGDNAVIDARVLETLWARMPEAARNAYPESARNNIEAFIAQAKGAEPFFVIPSLAARSLMMPKGELARQLKGNK